MPARRARGRCYRAARTVVLASRFRPRRSGRNWRSSSMRKIRAEELSHVLADATEQVLETMFFTTLESRLDAVPETSGAITAALSFQGELRGTFCLDLSTESACRDRKSVV